MVVAVCWGGEVSLCRSQQQAGSRGRVEGLKGGGWAWAASGEGTLASLP